MTAERRQEPPEDREQDRKDRTLILTFGRRRPRKWLRRDEWTGFTFRRLLVMWGRTDFAARLAALLDGIGRPSSDPSGEDRS